VGLEPQGELHASEAALAQRRQGARRSKLYRRRLARALLAVEERCQKRQRALVSDSAEGGDGVDSKAFVHGFLGDPEHQRSDAAHAELGGRGHGQSLHALVLVLQGLDQRGTGHRPTQRDERFGGVGAGSVALAKADQALGRASDVAEIEQLGNRALRSPLDEGELCGGHAGQPMVAGELPGQVCGVVV